MAYPQAVKDQAAVLYAEGISAYKIGKRLGISKTTILRWLTPAGQAYALQSKEDPKLREYQKIYREKYYQAPEVKERRRQYLKLYWQSAETKERERERHKEYMKKRRSSEPGYRVLNRLRNRTNELLRGRTTKSASTEKLLGISVLELVQCWNVEYGTGWQNNRELHIDHVRPCTSFNLLDPAQQCLCFNYRNLQLLSAAENISKGGRWTEKMEQTWEERMRDLGWQGELFLVFA